MRNFGDPYIAVSYVNDKLTVNNEIMSLSYNNN